MTAYTIFGQAGGATLAADPTSYTFAMQFTVDQASPLTGIWFYSPPSAGSLPSGCCIYLMTSPGNGTVVAGTENDSPSWSGIAGSGWVKCSYGGSVTLTEGNAYKVAVLGLSNAGSEWYSATSNYWTSGAGSGGLTSGPLSAPANSGGDGGQDTFNVGTSLAYPDTSFDGGNYWVDVEVTLASASVTGAVAALTFAAPAGSVSFTGNASVAGAIAQIAFQALPGTPAAFIPGPPGFQFTPGYAIPGLMTPGSPGFHGIPPGPSMTIQAGPPQLTWTASPPR